MLCLIPYTSGYPNESRILGYQINYQTNICIYNLSII